MLSHEIGTLFWRGSDRFSARWRKNVGGLTLADFRQFPGGAPANVAVAVARLAIATGEESYWDWYDRIWHYADEHMIDKRYGAWFRVLDRKNNKLSNAKSTAGAKCDYHTIGACLDVPRVLY